MFLKLQEPHSHLPTILTGRAKDPEEVEDDEWEDEWEEREELEEREALEEREEREDLDGALDKLELIAAAAIAE